MADNPVHDPANAPADAPADGGPAHGQAHGQAQHQAHIHAHAPASNAANNPPDDPADQEGHFTPDPIWTFCQTDDNIVCPICMESKLTLPPDDVFETYSPPDTVPCLLPCGHVFGHRCLKRWLRNNNECPACRLDLQCVFCPHSIKPRMLTGISIWYLPKTIPEGGTFPRMCSACQRRKHLQQWSALCANLWTKYAESRLRYELSGAENDRVAMEIDKQNFDDLRNSVLPDWEQQW